jgi:hypothetical protein
VQPSRATKPWTSLQIAELRQNAALGAVQVARLLHRSIPCVKACANRQRISLRSAGERRGSVLGQPRGVSLRAELRADLVSLPGMAELVASRMKIDADAALCPVCAIRPVQPKGSGGFCRPCHLRRLTEAHEQALEELSAQRALWSSRQVLHRERNLYPGLGPLPHKHCPAAATGTAHVADAQ